MAFGCACVLECVLRVRCGAAQGGGGPGRSRLTDSEAAEVEVVRRLVDSYFVISRKNLSDMVRAHPLCAVWSLEFGWGVGG